MIEVTFRDRRTNETIVRSLDFAWEGEDPSFWWRLGNGACDDNRSLYMYSFDRTRYINCCCQRNLIVIESISYNGAVVYQDAPELLGDRSQADQRKAQLDGAVREMTNVQASLIDRTLDLATEVGKVRTALATIAAGEKAEELLPIAQRIVAAGERLLIVFASPDSVDAQPDLDALDAATDELVLAAERML